jgi:predicted GH43/DUF377 family glycosyl hydrolase
MSWQLGPFTRQGTVLRSHPELPWGARDLFNPGAVVRDGMVDLLVRGEDAAGRYAGVSRIGLAVSADGVDFTVEPDPVLAPGDDRWEPWEGVGGCEDPRVVQSPDGVYVCLYTGFDGRAGTLMVATSDDLRTWVKHGPEPFLRPDTPDEQVGQVPNVCFAQALVLLADTWQLYYGVADSRIGHATAVFRGWR